MQINRMYVNTPQSLPASQRRAREPRSRKKAVAVFPNQLNETLFADVADRIFIEQEVNMEGDELEFAMKLTSPERTVHLPELWPNASKPRSKRFEGSEECKYPIIISFYRRQRTA